MIRKQYNIHLRSSFKFFGSWVDFRKSGCVRVKDASHCHSASSPQCVLADHLSAKTVEGLALPLESVHDIHGSDSLTASVLGVSHRVTDDVLEEDL